MDLFKGICCNILARCDAKTKSAIFRRQSETRRLNLHANCAVYNNLGGKYANAVMDVTWDSRVELV